MQWVNLSFKSVQILEIKGAILISRLSNSVGYAPHNRNAFNFV